MQPFVTLSFTLPLPGLMNTTVVQQALMGDTAGKPELDALRDGALGALIVVAIAVPGACVPAAIQS